MIGRHLRSFIPSHDMMWIYIPLGAILWMRCNGISSNEHRLQSRYKFLSCFIGLIFDAKTIGKNDQGAILPF